LRKNDEIKKLVVKTSCDLQHEMTVFSKDIFVKEEYLIEVIPLEGPCVEESC